MIIEYLFTINEFLILILLYCRILKERSMNKIKNQTTRSNPWFGQDGRLVALPNPIQRMATRPPILDESSSSRWVFYLPNSKAFQIL